MANSLRETLSTISKNIGLDDLEFLNSISDEVEVPENFADLFHANYLTKSAAKNNTDIRDFYKGKFLGTVDSKLKSKLKDTEFFTEIESEADTLEKLEKAIDYLNSQKGSDNNEDVASIRKQLNGKITELQRELESRKDWIEPAKFDESQKNWENKFFNYTLNDSLRGLELTKDLDFDEISILVNSKLNSLPYTFKRNENFEFEVYEKDNPELRVHKEGKPLSFNDVVSEVSNKWVKKSDPPKPTEQQIRVEKPDEVNSSYVMGQY